MSLRAGRVGDGSICSQVNQQYATHLHPHLDPYISRASSALAPYRSLAYTKIYTPYILPLLPTVLTTPQTPENILGDDSRYVALPRLQHRRAQRRPSRVRPIAENRIPHAPINPFKGSFKGQDGPSGDGPRSRSTERSNRQARRKELRGCQAKGEIAFQLPRGQPLNGGKTSKCS